jgi:hypothetical protein
VTKSSSDSDTLAIVLAGLALLLTGILGVVTIARRGQAT